MCRVLLRRAICRCVLFILLLSSSVFARTFKNPKLIATAYDPAGVTTADLNHDGKLDLVYVDGTRSFALHVVLNDGSGNFSLAQNIEVPQLNCSFMGCIINVGDVTHDGIPDVILGGGSPNTEVLALVGNGDGTFQQAIVSVVAPGQWYGLNTQIAIEDINGDGNADLAFPDSTNQRMYILTGDGAGHFTTLSGSAYYFTGLTYAYFLDLNTDGKLDLLMNDPNGSSTYVLLGNGNGTFQAANRTTTYVTTLVDLDADGHPDLVADVYPGEIRVLRGKGDGTFESPSVIANVPPDAQLVATADLNRDGFVDLTFSTRAGAGTLASTGRLSYGGMVSSLASGMFGVGQIAHGDLDGDGEIDAAVVAEGGILLLLGNGDGSFRSADLYDVGHIVGTVGVANFDNDPYPDIAVSVNTTFPRLLLGSGDGQFTLGPDQTSTPASPSTSMAVADFNGDGRNDVSLVRRSDAFPYGQPFVFFGSPNGTFAAPSAVAVDPGVVADVNGDARGDIVTLSEARILSLLGQTNGQFIPALTPLRNSSSSVAAAGDVNGDGAPDIIVEEYPWPRCWLGRGDGTYIEGELLGGNGEGIVGSKAIRIVDIDSDGNGDVIVLPGDTPIALPSPAIIFYSRGDGTFEDATPLPITHQYSSLVVRDINGDGTQDVVLSDDSGIAVIENLGVRQFGAERHYAAGHFIAGLSVVDVNGDTFPDIIAGNKDGTTVAVLLNEPDSSDPGGLPSGGLFRVSPEPAPYGQPITLSLSMSAPSGPLPTGTVTFNVEGSFVATVALVNGQAEYLYDGVLETGIHTLIATYSGDSVYRSEAFTTAHKVLAPVYATSTTLSADPETVLTSQTVRLTAVVTSSPAVSGGWVTFLDGTNTIGAARVDNNGVALLDTAMLSAGQHSISAKYQGYHDYYNHDAVYLPSTSAAVAVTVNSLATTTSISASSANPVGGTVVTFTATVSSGSGTPFGAVTFYDGTAVLGTVTLKSDGRCTYSTASLSIGSHNVRAEYNANATFGGSTSAPAVVQVTAASAALSRSAIALAAKDAGGRISLTARIKAGGGVRSGSVVFLDNGRILGTAAVNADGSAVLPLESWTAGEHRLWASFSGDGAVAPSVSPEFLEQTPAAGAAFSISVDENTIDLSRTATEPVLVHVTPAPGAQNEVQLSCVSGLPAGYECLFSPSQLQGGVSQLRIVPSTRGTSAALGGTTRIWGTTALFFALMVVGGVKRRRVRWLTASVLMIGLIAAAGCGTRSKQVMKPQASVLSISSSTSAATGVTTHTLHVFLTTDKVE